MSKKRNPAKIFLVCVAWVIFSCNAWTGLAPSPQPASHTSEILTPESETDTPAAIPAGTKTLQPSGTPPPTPVAEYEVEVPADVVWFNTKVALTAGRYVEIRASGKSNISGVPGNSVWEPDGDRGYCPLDCLMPGAGYGTLIGKFPGGLPFKVGSRFKMEMEADGVLLLAINDNEPYYFDNTGSYTVVIQVWEDPPHG
ncbi:MAG: hypothetical protein JW748_06085 [Anaerolineales bacterium]|nr:hypothetical protein [Anaerolineales bacterium]